MGMYEDYMVDMEFRERYPHGVNNDEWTTKEGKVLKLKDMTTAHIRNCMRMIGQGDDFWYAFEAELKRREEPVSPPECSKCPTAQDYIQALKAYAQLLRERNQLMQELYDAVELLRQTKSCRTCAIWAEYQKVDGDVSRCEECEYMSHWICAAIKLKV